MKDMVRRLLLASIFISLLMLLCLYHYLNHERYEYPGNEEVIKGFEGEVSIYGVVINSSDSSETYILVKYGSKSRIVRVLSNLDVENGDKVEILGFLDENGIMPEKTIVYKKWSYYLIFIRSVIAIPIVVYIFFKYWTFDFREMKFRRRKDA